MWMILMMNAVVGFFDNRELCGVEFKHKDKEDRIHIWHRSVKGSPAAVKIAYGFFFYFHKV